MPMQLEAIETTPENPYNDPLDRVGPRCQNEYPGIGKCHRRITHTQSDPWHHAMTDGDGPNRQFWRWCDRDD